MKFSFVLGFGNTPLSLASALAGFYRSFWSGCLTRRRIWCMFWVPTGDSITPHRCTVPFHHRLASRSFGGSTVISHVHKGRQMSCNGRSFSLDRGEPWKAPKYCYCGEKEEKSSRWLWHEDGCLASFWVHAVNGSGIDPVYQEDSTCMKNCDGGGLTNVTASFGSYYVLWTVHRASLDWKQHRDLFEWTFAAGELNNMPKFCLLFQISLLTVHETGF